MKLRAIRLREVGCFSDPVVVEGLSGGLDVLADNNEAGKSTLFRALRTVLLERHTTAKQDVEALRPYKGGAPVIEIDFDIGAARYRLRKQYLSGKSALLTDLAAGAVKRNVDADEEVFRLIGADGGHHPYGLFWVAQEESFAPAEPDERERAALAGIIQREVASITGGRRAQAIRGRAQESLDKLVTRQQMKPKGDYLEASNERDRLSAAIAEGEAETRKAEALFQALGEARARLAALDDPQAEGERQRTIETAAEALDEAQRAKQQSDEAHMKLQLAELAHADAEREAKELREHLESERRLVEQIAGVQSQLSNAEAQMAQATENLETARLRLDIARHEHQVSEALIQQIRDGEARQRVEDNLAALRDRLGQARQAQEKLFAARDVLSRNKLTAVALKALETEDREIAILRTQLATAAPSLSVAYDPGQEGRIVGTSGPLQNNTHITIDRSTEFLIEGIGRITIAPGDVSDMSEQSAKLQSLNDALERKLRRFGVASLEEARRLVLERSEADRTERSAQDQLRILAEKGIDHLQADITALELRVAESVPQVSMTVAEGTRRFDATRQALEQAMTQREEAQAARTLADNAHIALDVHNLVLRKQLSSLAGNLPPVGERGELLAGLDSKIAVARQAFETAQANFETKSKRVLTDDEMEGLRARRKRALEAVKNAETSRVGLRDTVSTAQGQLTQIFESGAGERLDENKEHLAAVLARIERLEREVAELKLLIETLDACAAEARSAFFAPVVKGLKPLLSLVLPGSEVAFGEDFTPESLSRSGRDEEFARLSGGTREQVAILVRLAFARLAAEAGRPSPVLLDDALVYADDSRIEKLFDALQIAAKAHQIILLTCRTKVFGPLGGTALRIERRDFA